MRANLLSILLLCGACLQGSHAQDAPPLPVLTTASSIARFPALELDPQPPVKLDATVTYIDRPNTVFLQDDTGATFIRSSDYGKSLKVGQRIHLEGLRFPGLYIGGIVPDKVSVLGENSPITTRKVTWEDLASGKYHYEIVEVEGVGRWVELTGEGTAVLRLNVDGKNLAVRFDQMPENAERFIDARLRVQGLAAGAINDRRQLVMPYLRVEGSQSVSLLEAAPDDPYAAGVIPVSALPQTSNEKTNPHRIKVKGVAMSGLLQGSFFLRDGDRSVQVVTALKTPLQPGDEVEVLGFVEMGVFSARLADAIFQVTGHTDAPAPKKALPSQLTSDGMDAELITLDGRVVQLLDDRQTLFVQCGSHSVKVLSPLPLTQALVPGAEVRLTGMCRVVATTEKGYRANASAFELWLRTPEEAIVTAAPPWWTTRRLSMALGAAALLAVLALVWATLLRRRVASQLAVIENKVQREAITEERQRIAREFHDTLEQELAGLSIRLDAAAPRVTDEKARSLLEQQRKLLMRLQTETRDFVWDLRDSTRHEAPLDKALGSLIEHLQVNTTTPLSFQSSGEVPNLPALVQHHLLSLTREAVNNAVKYSKAAGVHVTLASDAKILQLAVVDDGLGFDAAAAMTMEGHFGIRGMKERALKIGGALELISAPGKGTVLQLHLPLLHTA